MLKETFLVLLVMSFLASYAAISRKIDERIGGAFAVGLWGVTAAGALSHQTVVNDQLVTVSTPGVAIISVGGAFVMLVFLGAAVTGRLTDISATRFQQ